MESPDLLPANTAVQENIHIQDGKRALLVGLGPGREIKELLLAVCVNRANTYPLKAL